MPEPLADAQEAALQALNDKWGVASWMVLEAGSLAIVLDDGETGTVEPDGSNTWGV